MSVPEANALSPAPVMINALIERSALMLSQIEAICSYMAKVSALRACGRLKVIRAMPSSTVWIRSSSVLMGAFRSDALADRGHLLVHGKGQRVARLWPVEGDTGDAVLDRMDQVFIGAHGSVHGNALPFVSLVVAVRSESYRMDLLLGRLRSSQ